MKLSTRTVSLTLLLSIIIPNSFFVEAEVVSLTTDNFHGLTSGKAVFLKFFAPWCGHCKAMADDFEKLAIQHLSSNLKLVAEVDCTDEDAEQLCKDFGIEGFPTLKYGDPESLEDYDGAREYEDMNTFVTEQLKLPCGPYNLDECSEEEKQLIDDVNKMENKELHDKIKEIEKELVKASTDYQGQVEALQEKFEVMMGEHEEKIDKMQDDFHYDLKQAVLVFKKKAAGIPLNNDDDDDDDDDA